jgi:hypothetical protein
MDILERTQAKHNANVADVNKLRDKRDKALDVLIKAQQRYLDATRAVARSQRRLDKAREEERQLKKSQRKAVAESKKELPDIAAVLGV